MTRATAVTSALVGLALCASTATAASSAVFGSNNDGFGGFTHSPSSSTEVWTELTDSVQYRNTNLGTANSSLLKSIVLDRTPGTSYTITGVVKLTNGYADDNNRIGMYFFGDSAVVPNEDEAGALGLIFNTDDSSTGGPPGNNAQDNLAIRVGIDNTTLAGPVLRTQADTPTDTRYAQDLFGTEITFTTDISFVGANIEIDASMMTENGDVTTIPTLTVAAADYTGDYFGFVTRARARYYADGVEGSPEGRNLPWVMDYKSFTIDPEPVVVPGPLSSTAIAGLLGLGWLGRRVKALRQR